MSTGSAIEWTSATWNPVSGCTRVSAGCDHCYAVPKSYRLERMGRVAKYGGLTVLNPKGERHFNGQVRCHEDALRIPLGWKKPKRIFVNSMSDLFHKEVPFEFIDRVFAVMALCPQHTFQVLTKRPERMAEYMTRRYMPGAIADAAIMTFNRYPAFEHRWPMPNVWLGTSVENQKAADERIPYLLKCQAAVRFLSCEPLLGPVDLLWSLNGHACQKCADWGEVDGKWCEHPDPNYDFKHTALELAEALARPTGAGPIVPGSALIDWVIGGGESGPGARESHIDWHRSLLRQCKAAGVAYFEKQLGSKPTASYYDHDLRNWFDAEGWDWPNAIGWNYRDGQPPPGSRVRFPLKDRKGGDMTEWPDDLRVREFPTVEVKKGQGNEVR